MPAIAWSTRAVNAATGTREPDRDVVAERRLRRRDELARAIGATDPREAVAELERDVRVRVRAAVPRRACACAASCRCFCDQLVERVREVIAARVAERAAARRRGAGTRAARARRASRRRAARGCDRARARVASGSPPASCARPSAREPQRARVELAVVIVEPARDAMRIARDAGRGARREHRDAPNVIERSASRRASAVVERVAERDAASRGGGDPRVEPASGARRARPPTRRARSTARRRAAGRARA